MAWFVHEKEKQLYTIATAASHQGHVEMTTKNSRKLCFVTSPWSHPPFPPLEKHYLICPYPKILVLVDYDP